MSSGPLRHTNPPSLEGYHAESHQCDSYTLNNMVAIRSYMFNGASVVSVLRPTATRQDLHSTFLNRYVFSLDLKMGTDVEALISVGRPFHSFGAAMLKALSPQVTKLDDLV